MDMNRLEKLSALYGPSGREEQVAEYITTQLPAREDICSDDMLNLILQLGGA